MKFLKKIIRYLYFHFCDPDILGMTRLQMHGIPPELKLEELSHERQQAIYQAAQALLENIAFITIINNLKHGQRDNLLRLSASPEQVEYAFYRIDGFSTVLEAAEKLASQRDITQTIENKYSVT